MVASREVVTVPASLRARSGVALVANIVAAAGLFQMFGPGTTLLLACSLVAGMSVVSLIMAAGLRTQRLEIAPEGFTNYNMFGRGAQKRRWTEIDGHFVVIRIGWREAIAYRLTSDSRMRVSKKRTSALSGYDEAIPGLFQLSAPQLALLLNNHMKWSLNTLDVPPARGEKRP